MPSDHGYPTERDPSCERCNYDIHRCPFCGEWLYHGTEACADCEPDICKVVDFVAVEDDSEW